MNRKLIVITGYLAAGKSTFALNLSNALTIPYLIKDTFKTALCAGVTISDRAESSRFSAVTFDAMMYVTERLIETGCPVIIEGNFVPYGLKPVDEAGAIKELKDKYGCKTLTYKFTGDNHVLYERFIKREALPERGRANMMFSEPAFDEFNTWCRNLDGFDIGGDIITVDTTDFASLDYEQYINSARRFLRTGSL